MRFGVGFGDCDFLLVLRSRVSEVAWQPEASRFVFTYLIATLDFEGYFVCLSF